MVVVRPRTIGPHPKGWNAVEGGRGGFFVSRCKAEPGSPSGLPRGVVGRRKKADGGRCGETTEAQRSGGGLRSDPIHSRTPWAWFGPADRGNRHNGMEIGRAFSTTSRRVPQPAQAAPYLQTKNGSPPPPSPTMEGVRVLYACRPRDRVYRCLDGTECRASGGVFIHRVS